MSEKRACHVKYETIVDGNVDRIEMIDQAVHSGQIPFVDGNTRSGHSVIVVLPISSHAWANVKLTTNWIATKRARTGRMYADIAVRT